MDFFEDELVLNGYNWRQLIEEYLFKGKEPLVNCLVAGRMEDTPNNGASKQLTLQNSRPSVDPPGLCLRDVKP